MKKIDLININKSYERNVINNINYQFNEGNIYLIKGISGCGKTTLFNIIGGIDKKYQGIIKYDDINLKMLSLKKQEIFRNKISYVFQQSFLFSGITILDNLILICNNIDTIDNISKKLGLNHLLTKLPDTLSGGERQKISILRALLNFPELILFDEPTASLDSASSLEIAKIIYSLKSLGIIILISTHESCFDSISDYTLLLDDGIVKNEIKNNNSQIQNIKKEGNLFNSNIYMKDNIKVILSFIYKRKKDKYKLIKNLPLMIILVFILICMSVQINFKTEYGKILYNEYPINVFSIIKSDYERLNSRFDFNVYYNYVLEIDNILCLSLLPKEDSSLNINRVIEYGSFPINEYDVLITQEMAKMLFNSDNYYDYIGEKINLDTYEFIIVGILSDFDNEFMRDYISCNSYYNIENRLNIYLPYNTIKNIGTLINSNTLMVKIDNLYQNKKLYNEFQRELGYIISFWDMKIQNISSLINTIYNIIIITTVFGIIISYIFIKNEIELELYYRKKEIAYFQVFHKSKKLIKNMLLIEKFIITIFSLIVAIIMYFSLILMLYFIYNINGFLPIYYLLTFFITINLITYITMILPINKFLKKDIIQLL